MAKLNSLPIQRHAIEVVLGGQVVQGVLAKLIELLLERVAVTLGIIQDGGTVELVKQPTQM